MARGFIKYERKHHASGSVEDIVANELEKTKHILKDIVDSYVDKEDRIHKNDVYELIDKTINSFSYNANNNLSKYRAAVLHGLSNNRTLNFMIDRLNNSVLENLATRISYVIIPIIHKDLNSNLEDLRKKFMKR